MRRSLNEQKRLRVTSPKGQWSEGFTVAITYGKLGSPQICCNLPYYLILFVRLYYFNVLLILFICITSYVIAFKKACCHGATAHAMQL